MVHRPLPHNPVAIVDVFEQQRIADELSKNNLTIMRQNLVPLGVGDIFWMGLDGLRFSWEHKTIEQALAESGQRLDDQLRKHTQHADIVGLCIDGIAVPGVGHSGCDIFEPSRKNPKILVKTKKHPKTFEGLMSFFASISTFNIRIMYGYPDYISMCRAIAQMVYHSLTAGHKSLQHVVKTKPVLFEAQQYVETLMGLENAKIGEQTAKKILLTHKTPFNFYLSEFNENPELTLDQFKRAMKAIGRNV